MRQLMDTFENCVINAVTRTLAYALNCDGVGWWNIKKGKAPASDYFCPTLPSCVAWTFSIHSILFWFLSPMFYTEHLQYEHVHEDVIVCHLRIHVNTCSMNMCMRMSLFVIYEYM